MENFEQYFNHLFDLNNPILYSVFFTIFLLIFLILLYRGVFDPLKRRFIKEKSELEDKNVKLMALFAELDPNPLIRIDESGNVIQINDATEELFGNKSIIGRKISSILNFMDFNIEEAIQENQSKSYTEKIEDKFFSVIFKGNKYLNIGQIYLHDITKRVHSEEKLERSRLRLKELSTHLDKTLEQERRRLANELHDGLCQSIYSIKLKLQNKMANQLNEEEIKDLDESLDHLYNEARDMSHQLKPKILTELGVVPALANLVDSIDNNAEMRGSFSFTGKEERFDDDIEICLYRISQEALSNIVRHSKATEYSVQLINAEKLLRLIISDNGRGISQNGSGNLLDNLPGLGLLNMRERISNLGGRFKIESKQNEGVIIIIELNKVR
jgi:signal transduction histidine kinase